MRSFKSKLLIVSFSLMTLALLVAGSLGILFINQTMDADSNTIIGSLCESEEQKINNVLASVEQSANLMGSIAIEAYKDEYRTRFQRC